MFSTEEGLKNINEWELAKRIGIGTILGKH